MIKKPSHLAHILRCTPRELNTLIDNIDEYYYNKKQIKMDDGIPKKLNGIIQFRQISPSFGKLKKTQKLLLNRVLRNIQHADYVIGGIKGKSHITNARMHLGKKYKFKTDIKDFFPSIDNKMVYNTLINLDFSADVSRILTLLTTYSGSVPQGSPTSTDIANLVFAPIGKTIYEYCKNKNITYTQYIDDLYFSSQEDFKSATKDICKIILNSKFRINNNKTKYKIGVFNITGIITKNNILKPRPNQLERLNNSGVWSKEKQGLLSYFKQLKN